MEEMEVDPIESSPKEESYYNLSSNYDLSPLDHDNGDSQLAMEEFNCRIFPTNDANEDGDVVEELRLNDGNEPMKIVSQFYFVKIRRSFVDPTLTSKIENAKELWKYLDNVRGKISSEIDCIKRKIYKERDEMMWARKRRQDKYFLDYIRKNNEYWQQELDQNQWCDDEDLSAEPEPESEPELMNIDEKIQGLKIRLVHGSRNLAQERETLRELKEMQRKKEHSNHHVQTTSSKRSIWDSWNSKQAMQHRIREGLQQLRDREVKEIEATEQYERKKAEIEKVIIIPHEKKLAVAAIHKKIARVNQHILAAKQQLNEQTAFYNEQITMLNKAKELASKKDLVALEELSYKQVEDFMSLWKSSDAFRANHTRSVMPSLAYRRLSNDG